MNNKNKYQYSLEIVGSCNLRCPSCPVGNMNNREESKKMISKDLFIKIIDKIEKETPVKFPTISLFDWGEPTLHPELPFFIDYINKKKLKSRISSNLNIDANFKEILKSKPHEFKISISGFYEQTYSVTHKRGRIEKVFINMNKIKNFRDQFSRETKIIVGFHLYKHNLKKDFQEMKKYCNKMNFVFEPDVAHFMPIEKILSLISNDKSHVFPQVTCEDKELIKLLLTNPIKEHKKWLSKKNNNQPCTRLENKTAIRVDGSIPICCGVYSDKYIVDDNFLKLSFEEIKKKRENYDLCKICMKNGAHVNWKNDKNSSINKYLVKDNFFGKLTRFLYSN